MRAYVLKKSTPAPVVVERPSPAPGQGEVLVKTRAVAIHPVDLETRDGKNAMMLKMKRPFVPGVDFVGTVAGVGAGVADLAEGDTVYGYRGVGTMGAFAEELVVRRDELARAPAGDVASLATVPLPALCALQAIDAAQLDGGAVVLVHGGAGGVGSVAVQVFAACGYEVVATASSKDATWVKGLGATRVIDYRTTRFEDAVNDVDLVFDTIGGETLKRSFGVVRVGGMVVSLNAMPDKHVLLDAGFKVPGPLGFLLPVLSWATRRRAKKAGARFVAQVTVPSAARLQQAAAIADRRGGLETRLDQTFGFEELPAAMDHAASGKARGRVVVTV